ncbi:hypothetical protein ACKKBF_B05440 [Auxenochlorella protothecoides x Auxenochlorella symbiontica]
MSTLKPKGKEASSAPPKKLSFFKNSIAGTCAGFNVVLVGHPFDTVKVRLQTQSNTKPIYSGALDCFKKTLQWEGVKGLYKGMSSPMAGQMFFRATFFAAFAESKALLSRQPDGSMKVLTDMDLFKAGALTGLVASLTEAPIDFYKSQLQVQTIRMRSDPNYKPPFTNLLQCVRASLAHNGVKGPFQGLGITVLRNVPANAVYLGSFDALKRKFAERQGIEVRDLSMPHTMAAGGVAGTLYWLAIYPLDVIKSAMMTDSMVKGERRYPTMAATARALWAEGGAGRFLRGLSLCLMRAVPANAVMLGTVSRVQVMLGA